jgi:protein TonB
MVAGVIGGVGCLVGFAILVHNFMVSKDAKVERKVQVVQMIRLPPPPPPEEAPPPPPPKDEVPLAQNEPEPSPSDEAAPSETLGLDAEGSAGGDAFGLAARKGGHDLTGSGGAIFAWYTGKVVDKLKDELSTDPRIRSKRFSVAVKVWIEHDGRIREARLASTTGSRDLDQAIEAALAKMARMSEPPPLEMPQPLSLKIVSNI